MIEKPIGLIIGLNVRYPSEVIRGPRVEMKVRDVSNVPPPKFHTQTSLTFIRRLGIGRRGSGGSRPSSTTAWPPTTRDSRRSGGSSRAASSDPTQRPQSGPLDGLPWPESLRPGHLERGRARATARRRNWALQHLAGRRHLDPVPPIRPDGTVRPPLSWPAGGMTIANQYAVDEPRCNALALDYPIGFPRGADVVQKRLLLAIYPGVVLAP